MKWRAMIGHCVHALCHCSIGEWGKRSSFIRSMEQQDSGIYETVQVSASELWSRRCAAVAVTYGTICTHDAAVQRDDSMIERRPTVHIFNLLAFAGKEYYEHGMVSFCSWE